MTFASLPRVWRIVLVASLALNLVVVGVVLGSALGPHGKGQRHDRMAGPVAPLLRVLPDDARRPVLEQMQGAPSDRSAGRARFDALLDAVAAEPFDPDAVAAALAEQRRRGDERLARAEAALVDVLSTMTPEARAAYAQSLAESVRRR